MKSNQEEIRVNSELDAKEAPDIRQVAYKANAKLSHEEAIAKHVIGELDEDKEEEIGQA